MRLTPRSSRDEILGIKEGILRIKVAAPPVEGEANRNLVDVLKKRLGVPKSAIRIVRGQRSRDKRIEVDGISSKELVRLLG